MHPNDILAVFKGPAWVSPPWARAAGDLEVAPADLPGELVWGQEGTLWVQVSCPALNNSVRATHVPSSVSVSWIRSTFSLGVYTSSCKDNRNCNKQSYFKFSVEVLSTVGFLLLSLCFFFYITLFMVLCNTTHELLIIHWFKPVIFLRMSFDWSSVKYYFFKKSVFLHSDEWLLLL